MIRAKPSLRDAVAIDDQLEALRNTLTGSEVIWLGGTDDLL